MSKPKASRLELPEAGVGSGCKVVRLHGLAGRSAELNEVEVVQCGEEERSPHVCAEVREPRRECLLEPSGQRQRARRRRVCPELGRSGGKLDESQRVAGRLVEDPALELGRQRRSAEVEERCRRILVQPGETQLGQVGVLEGARQSLADRE
jgi:hypothetical protein